MMHQQQVFKRQVKVLTTPQENKKKSCKNKFFSCFNIVSLVVLFCWVFCFLLCHRVNKEFTMTKSYSLLTQFLPPK